MDGQASTACPTMLEYRRRLPHFQPDNAYIFLTWRLFGSLPAVSAKGHYPTAGHAFVAADRALDRLGSGNTGCAINALPAWWLSRFGAEKARDAGTSWTRGW